VDQTVLVSVVTPLADHHARRHAGGAITIVGNTVMAAYRDGNSERAGEIVTTQRVTNLVRFVEHARELRVALAQFPDFEVVYLFDLAQDGYGYADNVQEPIFSEWGTAPIRLSQTALGE
jgi:hypothetical protein